MHITEKQGGTASYSDKLGKYLLGYVCILVIAGLQFGVACQHIDAGVMTFRMFALAVVEAGLLVVFFMHLGWENRVFVAWLAIISLFLLASLQFVWPDSYRMRRDAPPSYHTRPAP